MTNITQELIAEIAQMDEEKQHKMLDVARSLNNSPVGIPIEEFAEFLRNLDLDPSTIEAVAQISNNREIDDDDIEPLNSIN